MRFLKLLFLVHKIPPFFCAIEPGTVSLPLGELGGLVALERSGASLRPSAPEPRGAAPAAGGRRPHAEGQPPPLRRPPRRQKSKIMNDQNSE